MEMTTTRISIVAAIGKNRELGNKNELLWHIPDDLKRFKELTLGHPVIMGRKTFDSIVATLGKPLPGRTNIVITREPHNRESTLGDNTYFVASIEEGIAMAKEFDSTEIFVIGGGQIYASSVTYVDKLYLTLIDDAKEGDTFFPEYEQIFTKTTFEEDREWNGLKYRWVDLERN